MCVACALILGGEGVTSGQVAKAHSILSRIQLCEEIVAIVIGHECIQNCVTCAAQEQFHSDAGHIGF